MQSPPSQRSVVKPLELISYLGHKIAFDRFGLGEQDLAVEWEHTRTLQGSELVEYFNAFNPLFIESDKGMDIPVKCHNSTLHVYGNSVTEHGRKRPMFGSKRPIFESKRPM